MCIFLTNLIHPCLAIVMGRGIRSFLTYFRNRMIEVPRGVVSPPTAKRLFMWGLKSDIIKSHPKSKLLTLSCPVFMAKIVWLLTLAMSRMYAKQQLSTYAISACI